MTRAFQKRIEDFTCEHCGAQVTGTGYTNHCPKCLWSKHVDVNPGDRSEPCGGAMEPIDLALYAGQYTITHRCHICSFTRRNKVKPTDNTDAVITLSRRLHGQHNA